MAATHDQYDSSDVYKDYGVRQIFLSALKHLQRKNDNLLAYQPVDQRATRRMMKEYFIYCSKKADTAGN